MANVEALPHDNHHQYGHTRMRKMNLSNARSQLSIMTTDSSESMSNDMSTTYPKPNSALGRSNSGSSFSIPRSKIPNDHPDDIEGRSPPPTHRNTKSTRGRSPIRARDSFVGTPARSPRTKEKRTTNKYNSSPSGTNLTEDITEFLAIVSELEEVSKKNDPTPVERWKINKLADSANSLAEKIEAELISKSPTTSKMKISRDFRRAKSTMEELSSVASMDYKKTSQQNFTSNCGGSADSECTGRDSLSVEMRELETSIKREDEYNTKIMKEREAEVTEINKKMHQVNEIYKDLGDYVQSQQEVIDKVEDNIDESNANAKQGLDQIERANRGSMWRKPKRSKKIDTEEKMERDFTWEQPFETIRDDLKEVSRDFMQLGCSLLDRGKIGMELLKNAMLKCTQPDATADDFIS